MSPKTKNQIDKLLDDADDVCEDANRHDFVGLALEIYDRASNLVPDKLKLDLAKEAANIAINF